MTQHRQISLLYKVFLGYIVLMAIIGSMVAIVLHERRRVQKIENESISIFQTQHNINTAHRYITSLVTYGESVMVWNNEDSMAYRERRSRTDSMLQTLRTQCRDFIQPKQIDSLRTLLAAKEEYLFQIMKASRQQKRTDSLLFNLKPTVTKQITTQTITRKKKGIAGIFGGKETVQMPVVTTRQTVPNKELISLLNKQQRGIETYTDSLRLCNKELNRELRLLITSLDEQTWNTFRSKEERLKASYERSSFVITGLIVFSLIMLVALYLVIQRDIKVKARTKKRLEETIEQNTALLNMRKNIILTLSHDIRTPLNIITGNTELAMDTREKKQRNIYLKNIGNVCLHVVQLLNNLLDVYLLNEANEKRKDVPFNLHEMLERTATGFSHMANNKGIRFVSDFKNTEVRLYGDAVRIEQIMDNLLANAVKFTESGTISFHVRYHDGRLTLEIEDTGSGMTEKTLSRIFRPFERQASATNADGHGLGLSITQGLVKLLDGKIKVTSSIEQGSTFRVTLPLRQTDEPVESEKPVQPHFEHLPRRVLVIDDNNMLRDVVKKMLERNGIVCTACSSVKELVKAMRSMDYDLLLSDIQMPGTNGFDLLALLRNSSIGNSRTIPVVAMTARGDNGKKDYLEAGFAACIYKPFFLPDLLNLLSTIKECREDENRKVDFNTMLAEVNDKAELLGSFIEQSGQDTDELASAMNGGNRKRLREIAHRMQPMWELLQMGGILSDYRTLLKDSTTDDDIIQKHTQQIIECTALLIAEAENEIKRLENETENTDS